MSLLDHALAGARHDVPAAQGGRSAFVIGNVGKLGGELLNVLLERPEYARVAVGVRKPMRVEVPRLTAAVVPPSIEGWNVAQSLGWVPDDVYLCLEPERASFWKGERPYAPINASQAVTLACALRAAGARRAALLSPIEVLLQVGMVPVVHSAEEMTIVQAGYERLLVLRPVAEDRAQGEGGFLGAVGSGVVRIIGSYMTPKGLQPVRVRRAAQITIDSLAALENGVHVMGAARLRELAGDPMEAQRKI
jgi:hypothetical protein